MHVEKQDYEAFDKSWIARSWINSSIPYNSEIRAQLMYASEDKLDSCKKKLIKHLKDEQKRIIQNAKNKLDELKNIQ